MTRLLLQELAAMAADLDRLGIPWALAGGLAVAVRAEPRTTRDVDIVVSVADPKQGDRLVRSLRERGWWEISDGTIFRRGTNQLAVLRLRRGDQLEDTAVVDLLFNATGIEKEIVQRADQTSILPGVVVPVARLSDLIAMKVVAMNENRPFDSIDLRALLSRANASELEEARGALRLIEESQPIPGRRPVQDLDRLIDHFASRRST